MNLKEIKNWSPDVEKPITEKWRASEQFKFDKKSRKKTYSIDTPPPYVNAPVHIGQAITYCYMDFFARYKRMKGFQVIFPLGLDRNGLPIEVAAEKKFGISPFKVSRDEFIDKCKKLLNETSSETEDTFSKLGISFTSYRKGNHVGSVYETDSPEYRKITQSTFIELFKKGMIYEDTRINNWDPKLQTTIADSEIDYKEIPSTLNFVRWKVKETRTEIIIATTRPELICTCGMVIFNPEDKRYNHLNGKTAVSPIFGKEVRIKAHPMADKKKGTGAAMMCSAGDLSDIQFFRDENLKPVIAINKDGRMNENAGFLQGLKVKEARQKIIDELKGKRLLAEQKQIIHRTPISERSGAEIEFIEMPELYLKQVEFKDKVRKIVENINFYPGTSKEILISWIDSVSIDWPISRRRFYATPIPLWIAYIDGEKITALGKPGKYYEPWKEEPEKDFPVFKNGKKIGTVKDFKVDWKGEERVFDTWMDSSISELVLLKYLEDKQFFKKNYPCSLRPQGKEIIRTWLYYTLLRGYFETEKKAFNDVWINQHIVDANGYKMSKSKGNIIDPQILLKKYGAEAIRLWAATEGDLSRQDLKCSEERIKGELKTINKLINIAKFISQFKKPKKRPKLTEFDQLFVDYFNLEIHQTEEIHYNRYDFYKPAVKLRNFLWSEFASHYLELIKPVVYNKKRDFTKQENESAIYTLYYMLEMIVTLLHPIIPQATSIISRDLKINLIDFPKLRKPKRFDYSAIAEIMDFNSSVWQTKKEKGQSLNSEISNIRIPGKLMPFKKVLKAAHNLI